VVHAATVAMQQRGKRTLQQYRGCVFSNPLSLHLSSIETFPLAPCSQTPLVCVPALISETKLYTYTEPQENLSFYVFWQRYERQYRILFFFALNIHL
jgi:hypothetical protein